MDKAVSIFIGDLLLKLLPILPYSAVSLPRAASRSPFSVAATSKGKFCGDYNGDPAQAQRKRVVWGKDERRNERALPLGRNERYGARKDEAEFRKGTPQQDDRRGENEQKANFGTVVESCSKLLPTTPIAVFSKLCETPFAPLRSFSKGRKKSTLDF